MNDNTNVLPVVTKVGDREVTLKKLSNYERFEMIARERREARAQIVADMKDAEIKGVNYFATLQQFDHETRSMNLQSAWVDYANGPNQYGIILASVKKTITDVTEAERLAKEIDLPFGDFCTVCGLEPVKQQVPPPAADEEGEGDDVEVSDPGEAQHPLAYGAKPTPATSPSIASS